MMSGHTGKLTEFKDAVSKLGEGQKALWLQASQMESIPFSMGQQLADEMTAQAQVAEAMNFLEASPKLRAFRLRLKVQGKPFDELNLVQRLVMLIDAYDEVINDG